MTSQYVVGTSSPFRKRLLFTFCISRVIMSSTLAVLCTIAYSQRQAEDGIISEFMSFFGIGTGVPELVFSIIFSYMLLVDILSMILRALRRLSPVFFFRLNMIQAALSTLIFVFRIITKRTEAWSIWANMAVW